MSGAQVARWFPPGFFDASFALVRHPVARIVSAYHFDLRTRSATGSAPSFSDWLSTALADLAADPFTRDMHLRPQVDFLPHPDIRLFPLEEGMAPVIDWLDTQSGQSAPDLEVPHSNRGKVDASDAAARLVTAPDLARIGQVYRVDFERLGYHVGLPAPPTRSPTLRDRVLRRLGVNWPP
jgi:hypothetical protein